ncbi:MAG TPA: fumarylacetoacetate hydrolase family protein [Vicinamibacterales bacterium]|nr:fumarylacetoacetate hydrolase family protein [Vicinamibacterales bacterium]
MSAIDSRALADEIETARAVKRTIATPPSARDGGLPLAVAYEVEAELARRRRAAGHAIVGRKIGFANKALWRVMGLDTVAWGSMYDDTVQHATNNNASLSAGRMFAPKIEPEIVFKLAAPPPATSDPAAMLGAVQWCALGFEIIDCCFADWKFQPADFVAAYGFHAGLVVGAPMKIDAGSIPELVEALGKFKVQLSKDGEVVEEGSGRNVLRSPALALAELASAIAAQPSAEPLTAGELVSTGTLTTSRLIAPGEHWTATVDGLDLPALALEVTA